MPRLSVPLTEEQHIAIKVKAAHAGLTQAEVARRLLFFWLLGAVNLPHEGMHIESTLPDEEYDQMYHIVFGNIMP
jgi:hypothetical protein